MYLANVGANALLIKLLNWDKFDALVVGIKRRNGLRAAILRQKCVCVCLCTKTAACIHHVHL